MSSTYSPLIMYQPVSSNHPCVNFEIILDGVNGPAVITSPKKTVFSRYVAVFVSGKPGMSFSNYNPTASSGVLLHPKC